MAAASIENHEVIAHGVWGGVEHGLFFRGSQSVPFGAEIRPVRDLIEYLLH